MKTLQIKAVIITNGTNYFIHGTGDETPAEMFKSMQPIWDMDPSKETVHFVNFEMNLPDYENLQDIEDNSMFAVNAPDTE